MRCSKLSSGCLERLAWSSENGMCCVSSCRVRDFVSEPSAARSWRLNVRVLRGLNFYTEL